MLESMRQNIKSLQFFLWLVIIAFIGTMFFVWGLGGRRRESGGQNAIGWVNGKPILFKSFEQEYRRIYSFYSQLYGDNLTGETLKTLQLEQMAFKQLTRKVLLVEEARRYDLDVSDAELVKAIREIPQFQKDNQFDPETYTTLLTRGLRLTPQEFEEQMIEDLLVKKFEHLIKQTVRVSDQEVLEDYIVENEKVQVDGILIKSEQFEENAEFTDEDVASYYETYKETFRTPQRVKVQYIHFDPQPMKAEITPTEEEIRQYYEEHESEFNKGKEVNARHILFRLDQEADEETEAAVQKKAEEVLQKLKEGADFAEMAKEYSEDPASGENGGDLGFFAKGMIVSEFEEAAFAMKEGELSDLVRTRYGYHIIKVEKIREEPDPFGKAKPSITDLLKLEGAKKLALERAEESYQRLLDTGDLQQVAKDAEVDVQVSQFFAMGEPIDENTPAIPSIQEVAFTLGADEKFSQMIDTPLGYYLLEFLELQEPYIPELGAITEKVADAVRKAKAKDLANAEAQKIEADLKNGVEWDEIIESYAVEQFSPQPFSRRQRYISEAKGNLEEFIKIAFSLKAGEFSSVIELSQDYGIIRFLEKIEIDQEKFEEEQETLKQQVLQQKQNTVFQELVEELNQKAEITISDAFAEFIS